LKLETESFYRLTRDLRIALMLLTRLPVKPVTLAPSEQTAKSAWAYPLAGTAVALISACVACLALWTNIPALLAALLAIGTLVITTGAMHEDGLADSADGFWGGWDRDRRLEIMRDSRIGTYGVLALILALSLRGTAYAALFATSTVFAPLLVAAMLSRAAMVYVMATVPNARKDGLSKSTGRPNLASVQTATALATMAAFLFLGWTGLLAVLATAAVTLLWSKIAMSKIGGQTGDVLGATQQITEIAVLLTLTASL